MCTGHYRHRPRMPTSPRAWTGSWEACVCSRGSIIRRRQAGARQAPEIEARAGRCVPESGAPLRRACAKRQYLQDKVRGTELSIARLNRSIGPTSCTIPRPPHLPCPRRSILRSRRRCARILDGAYAIFDRMPSESELMQCFSVSGVTARQAMSQLCQGAWFSKSRARAAMCRAPRSCNRPPLFRVSARPCRSLVTSPRRAFTARAFSPPTTGATRPRSRDPQHLCHPRKRSALPVGRAELDIGATDACADTAHALGTPMRSPIPRMDRLTFDRDGRPLDHKYLYCRGDQWRYRLRIERRGTRGGRAS